MEVVPNLSTTVSLGTGGAHGGDPFSLKHSVIGYWRCTWIVVLNLSSTMSLGTGGVHGGDPCPLKHGGDPFSLKHSVIGYWRCTWKWSLTSQALRHWVLAVYVEVVPAVSSTVSLGTGGVHGGGP